MPPGATPPQHTHLGLELHALRCPVGCRPWLESLAPLARQVMAGRVEGMGWWNTWARRAMGCGMGVQRTTDIPGADTAKQSKHTGSLGPGERPKGKRPASSCTLHNALCPKDWPTRWEAVTSWKQVPGAPSVIRQQARRAT